MTRIGSSSQLEFLLLLSQLCYDYNDALLFTPPKSTITDHLKDCFGFWFYKRRNRFDEFAAAFCKSLLKEMPWLKGMGV